MFCTKIITRPTPNSTADKTRKKNVKDKKFALSYKIPRDRTKTYKVIHKISAVNSKWRAELTLIDILAIINIKNRIYRFISPKYIKYLITFSKRLKLRAFLSV